MRQWILIGLLFYQSHLIRGESASNRTEFPFSSGSRYPNVVRTSAHGLDMTWYEKDGENFSVLFSSFDGQSWSSPVVVVESDRLFVNWADFASVFRRNDGSLAVHYLEKSAGGTYTYDVKVKVSDDGGVNWSEGLTPHQDGTKSEHGFVSFFTHPTGDLGLVWLDGRNMVGISEYSSQAEMSLYATTLKGEELGPEVLLDGRVCECCPTAALKTDGGVVVAYRDRSHDEIRNINIVRFENGDWSRPEPVHEDQWRIAACPVNGPALAGEGRSIAVAWYTAPGDEPRINVAFSEDGGSSFGSPVRMDSGSPIGRVDLVWLGDGRVLVSWIELVEEGADLNVRSVSMNGDSGPVRTVSSIQSGRGSGYPQMELLGDRLLFLWSDPGKTYKIKSVWLPVSEFD